MSPFDPDLCAVNPDYARTATALHKLVLGNAAIGFTAHVRGTDPDDGAVVGVAYYESAYCARGAAAKRATEILRHVKALRIAAIAPATKPTNKLTTTGDALA